MEVSWSLSPEKMAKRQVCPVLDVLSGEQYGPNDLDVARSVYCQSAKYVGPEEGIQFVDYPSSASWPSSGVTHGCDYSPLRSELGLVGFVAQKHSWGVSLLVTL